MANNPYMRSSKTLSALKGNEYSRKGRLSDVQMEIEGLKLDNEMYQGLIEVATSSIEYGKNKNELKMMKMDVEKGVNAYMEMTNTTLKDHNIVKFRDIRKNEDLSIWDIGTETFEFSDGKVFNMPQVTTFSKYIDQNQFENFTSSLEYKAGKAFTSEGNRSSGNWSYDNSNVSAVPIEGTEEDALRVAMLKDIDVSKRIGQYLFDTRGGTDIWAKKTSENVFKSFNENNPGNSAANEIELNALFSELGFFGNDDSGRSAFDYLAFHESGYDPEGLFGQARDETHEDFKWIHPINDDGSRDYGPLGINDRHGRAIDWQHMTTNDDGTPGKTIDVNSYLVNKKYDEKDATTVKIHDYLSNFYPTETTTKGFLGKEKTVLGENEWLDELEELQKANIIDEDFNFLTNINKPLIGG